MRHDLVKTALGASGAMASALKNFGSGAGMGAMVGGAGGALLGAGRGALNAHDQGESALQGGLSGAWSGAKKGLAVGALAGGAAGALRPSMVQQAAQSGFGLGSASNFGQRQVHAFTGVGSGDRGYLRSIGAGASDSVDRVRSAEKSMEGLSHGSVERTSALKELAQAKKGLEAAEHSEGLGITSLPGYAKALYKNPGEALAAGVKDQWQNMGTGGRALMYGLPAAGVAGELSHQDDASGEGRGRFERAGRLAGTAASSVLAPLPIAGDLAFGEAATKAFGAGGRGLDRALARLKERRGGGRPTPAPEDGGSTAQAEGYIMSDRAAGTTPETLS